MVKRFYYYDYEGQCCRIWRQKEEKTADGDAK